MQRFLFPPALLVTRKRTTSQLRSVAFAIISVDVDPGGGFTGENRWKVTVVRDDNGESEIITLPTNEKRDAQLKAAKEHITASGPISGVKLVKRGNAYYFRGAEPRGS